MFGDMGLQDILRVLAGQAGAACSGKSSGHHVLRH